MKYFVATRPSTERPEDTYGVEGSNPSESARRSGGISGGISALQTNDDRTLCEPVNWGQNPLPAPALTPEMKGEVHAGMREESCWNGVELALYLPSHAPFYFRKDLTKPELVQISPSLNVLEVKSRQATLNASGKLIRRFPLHLRAHDLREVQTGRFEAT